MMLGFVVFLVLYLCFKVYLAINASKDTLVHIMIIIKEFG